MDMKKPIKSGEDAATLKFKDNYLASAATFLNKNMGHYTRYKTFVGVWGGGKAL